MEKAKENQENQNFLETTQQSEISNETVTVHNATMNKPKKLITIEDVKMKYDKPILGSGMGVASTLSSTGAIKKAKISLMADKKKSARKTATVKRDTVKTTAPIEIEQPVLPSQIDNQLVGNSTTEKSPGRLLNRRESTSPDMRMEDEDFQFPRKHAPWSELIKAKTKESFNLETRNSFDSLSEDSEDEEQRTQFSNTTRRVKPRRKNQTRLPTPQTKGTTGGAIGTKKNVPPPIVLRGELQDLTGVKKRLEDDCGLKQVTFKYTRYNTLIQASNETDYDKLMKYFKEQQTDAADGKCLEFHTYTPAPRKTHAFVVRGLDFKPDPDELKDAFSEEYDIEISSVYQMHTKYRPLYMIVTSSAITQKYLQNTVKYIMNVRVFIEERQNVRRIIQCHRCQEWGHATSNCYRSPRCLKCAEGHATKDCQKPKGSDPKCCNCGEKHPANATACRVYQRKLADLEGTKDAKKTRYVPAPQLKTNAWQMERISLDQTKNGPAPRRASDFEGNATDRHGPPQLTSDEYPELGRSSRNTRNDTVDEVVSSVKIVEELNKKVNFKELNRALNDLNQNMRHVKTGVEAFQIYYQFIENLENTYHILN